jgi:hypothetical protein
LEGLLDEPRPGAPRSITDAQVAEVVIKTLESMPTNSTHWSTRLMAEKTGLSQTAIADLARLRIAAASVENFKFSKDPQFVEKVRDIVVRLARRHAGCEWQCRLGATQRLFPCARRCGARRQKPLDKFDRAGGAASP